MKILMINKFLYPNGGSETYIFELGKQLEKMGHEVQYFGMEHEGRCVGNRVGAYTSGMDFHGGSRLAKLTYPLKTIYSSEARQKLREFLEKYKGNVDRSPHLYGEFIHSVFAKALLEQQMRMENAGLGAEAQDPELGILYRDLGEFSDGEIPKAISMIENLARQLNGELSARRKSSAHSGKLDFRATIRKSLATGGTLHDLKFRKKHPKRKRLVILCDVSGSMMQFSEFALRFIQSLNQIAESSQVFLFSESIVEADPFQLQNMDRFRATVRDSGIYGRGTNLGLALETLCAMRPPVLNGATTLLILSDTKTVDTARAAAALAEAKHQAGRVLWLNPIPERNWKYLKSTVLMSTLVPMIPCSTLGELAAACRRLT